MSWFSGRYIPVTTAHGVHLEHNAGEFYASELSQESTWWETKKQMFKTRVRPLSEHNLQVGQTSTRTLYFYFKFCGDPLTMGKLPIQKSADMKRGPNFSS